MATESGDNGSIPPAEQDNDNVDSSATKDSKIESTSEDDNLELKAIDDQPIASDAVESKIEDVALNNEYKPSNDEDHLGNNKIDELIGVDQQTEPVVDLEIPLVQHQDNDIKKLQQLCMGPASAHDDIRSKTTDSILQLLVTEDMSSIKSAEALNSLFVDHLHLLPSKVISEILSVLIAIVKKSVFHLESARRLLIPSIDHLLDSELAGWQDNGSSSTLSKASSKETQSSGMSLTKHFIREWINLLIAHSCDVEELISILKFSEHDPSLLSFLQQANQRQRNRPAAFFAFPGTKGSMMSLPPFQKWPIQLGWSFSTWFFLEPKACAQPYLYNFKTGKSGLGYSAHFTGNCLVLTSIRVKGKGVQHCIAYEFPSNKWIHCAIAYHNKWRASEIKVYVNGQLSANIEMPWQVQTTEVFDKCFIGGSGSITGQDRSGELNCFCGQMSAIYLFNEGLSPAQICAIHRLGPSYIGQFKYSNESLVNLPPQISKALYEEKLASTLFCLFTPVAVDSGTLCIQLASFKSSTSASAQNYFISAPHAALLGQTKAIITEPICSTLQSLGCSRSLLPLLDAFASQGNSEACASLIGFLCDLLENSPHWFANEIVQNNGFVMVACSLARNSRLLLSEKLLDIFLGLTRTLLTTSSTAGDSLLLKHLMDNILFNPTLWVYADTKLQIKLYSYLATEFLHGTRQTSNRYTIANPNQTTSYVAYNPTSSAASALSNQNYAYPNPGSASNTEDPSRSGLIDSKSSSVVAELIFGEVRRVSTVLQSLHALKYFYWVAEEKNINPKARNQKLRPHREELMIIRSQILSFTKELIVRANTIPLDEMQGILNYLSSCTSQENLLDVIGMLSSLLREHPVSTVAALDQKQGIRVIFTLIESQSERVCIEALKLLCLFLAQCTNKKKQEIMGPSNLFMLLCDRLRSHRPLTLEIYEALVDIMVENVDDETKKQVSGPTESGDLSRRRNMSAKRIENSIVIKVIATLIYEERTNERVRKNVAESRNASDSSTDIREIFINDLWNLIVTSKENRRTILQMSVWQHWLINLIDSTISENSQLLRDQVLAIFRVLLYHAIRYEYGGWRVWIDTLAIIHTKVSYDEFCHQSSSRPSLLNDHSLNERNFEEVDLQHENLVTQENPDDRKSTGIEGDKDDLVKSGLEAISANEHPSKEEETENPPISSAQQGPTALSSISGRIPRESSGIQMDDSNDHQGVDEIDSGLKDLSTKTTVESTQDRPTEGTISADSARPDISLDSVDLAPSRAFRKLALKDNTQDSETMADTSSVSDISEPQHAEISRQQSLTSIPLEETSNDSVITTTDDNKCSVETKAEIESPKATFAASNELEHCKIEQCGQPDCDIKDSQGGNVRFSSSPEKVIASPAFRIPEFRWSSILIKLLNDLMFSIECDLYNWRCSAKFASLDNPPFVPKSANPIANQQTSSGNSTTGQYHSNTSNATGSRVTATTASTNHIESLLQRPENQVYIINIIHFVSQLADNVIIASGGLLPLLADATGGARSANSASSAANSPGNDESKATSCEGLTVPQANSILYRLINMVDVVIFAASHISLNELEADKNTTSGGILRQCLRLACTVTVKNCLVLRGLANKIASLGIGGEHTITANDFPKNMFDSYQGCSLLAANGLFDSSPSTLEHSDLVASIEFSPSQTPNTSSMPSLLPFQSIPIKDPNKLLQSIDISRIQTCIYYDSSTESRQSQFLALSSLYFISVLMVSKYRDIIEPRQQQKSKLSSAKLSPAQFSKTSSATEPTPGISGSQSSGFQTDGSSTVSSIESNLLTFGKMQPNATGSLSNSGVSGPSGNALTDMLTTKLENTLDTICPLLKSIMCDFSVFLSKTLIGSHGQDLVNKEADRTFKRANLSPVELVMLLCSQEWQNTLQKNAGLAFIELINEGRVLSHGMKDHIVRVAMEAEFILSRLRADDVAKHEHFMLACSETQSGRLHEEVLINSLISSATRRDYMLYRRFKDKSVRDQGRKDYKLDIWEDDDRRKRRFIIDVWDDAHQSLYSSPNVCVTASGSASDTTKLDNQSGKSAEGGGENEQASDSTTKRILELQQSIELGGANHHCSPVGASLRPSSDDSMAHQSIPNEDCEEEEEEEEEEDDEEEEEDGRNDSNGFPDSDTEQQQRSRAQENRARVSSYREGRNDRSKGRRVYSPHNNRSRGKDMVDNSTFNDTVDANDHTKSSQLWAYDESGSISNEFTGSVIFAAECSLIWNIYAIPGVFQLTNHELYFEPNQNLIETIDLLRKDPPDVADGHKHDSRPEGNKSSAGESATVNSRQIETTDEHTPPIRKLDLKALRYCDFLTCNGKILLNDIRAIFSRHYLLQPNALEIFLAQRTSIMFAFSDFDTVKRAVKYLPPVGVGIKYGIPQSRRASLMGPRQLFTASNMMQKWQKREIGNFQYLMFLNTIAGRSYQDLNQYPVFPWILTNYESDSLDLNLPSNFRDLSKPVGALNNKRRSEFIERYQSWDNPKVPAFHYGTHYSTAAFTLNWLCRLRGPSNSAYLALQDGKYEEDSRLFLSLGDSWVSSLTGGQQNVKELIPEFFYLPEMFHSNLGLPEVELPAWAKTAEQFVRMHRLALESELVSCQLHQWIDLIFGYKQRGSEAINAVNTFYYLTYQGNVNLNMIQDQSLRDAIETQIKHFGQTPSQLTTEPHPPRFSALHVSPLVFSSAVDEINRVVKFPFNTSIVHISSCLSSQIILSNSGPSSLALDPGNSASTGTVANPKSPNTYSSILTITSNNQYQVHKWMPNEQSGHPFIIDPQLEHSTSSASRRQLIDIDDLCPGICLKLNTYNSPQIREDISDEIQWPCAHYVVTLDGRYIIMGSFYDNSFRVFSTENGKLCQVIYGHRGPITCIERSEGNSTGDFHVATGSQDCSLLLWTWNDRYAQVEGSGVSAVHNPLPKLTISGHRAAILSVVICTELGLIISGSKNLILVNTTTSGENLIEIDVLLSNLIERSSLDGKVYLADDMIQRPQVKDKQRTILEASMLGDGGQQRPSTKTKTNEEAPNSSHPSFSLGLSDRFGHLKNLCPSDYFITNLQLARELAFIVCVALPPPKRKSRMLNSDSAGNKNTAAILMTFNLKGSLMDCTTIGLAANSPRLGDVCTMQLTRDGEHIVLNDSPTTLKIYRTFDLQPIYAYNTNDIPNALSDDQNRVKSLALLDHKYILAGLENGKIIVYNADFKNL